MGLLCSSRKFWLITDVFHAGHSDFIIHLLNVGILHTLAAEEIPLVNRKGFPLPHSADEVYHHWRIVHWNTDSK